jgi:hypothetical protein
MVPVLGERNPSDDDASVEVGTFPPSFKGAPLLLVWGSMGPAKTARAGGEHRRSARRAARPDKAAIPPKADKPSASKPRCSGHVPASLADVIRRFSNDATSHNPTLSDPAWFGPHRRSTLSASGGQPVEFYIRHTAEFGPELTVTGLINCSDRTSPCPHACRAHTSACDASPWLSILSTWQLERFRSRRNRKIPKSVVF